MTLLSPSRVEAADQYIWLMMDCLHRPTSSQPFTFDSWSSFFDSPATVQVMLCVILIACDVINYCLAQNYGRKEHDSVDKPFATCHTSKLCVVCGIFSHIHFVFCGWRSVTSCSMIKLNLVRNCTTRTNPSFSIQLLFFTSLLYKTKFTAFFIQCSVVYF